MTRVNHPRKGRGEVPHGPLRWGSSPAVRIRQTMAMVAFLVLSPLFLASYILNRLMLELLKAIYRDLQG